MSSDDTEYYRARAAAERDLAKSASQENVALIHEELARQYEALADNRELRPKLLLFGQVRGIGVRNSPKADIA